jgi:hypothetical protein
VIRLSLRPDSQSFLQAAMLFLLESSRKALDMELYFIARSMLENMPIEFWLLLFA